MDSVKFGVKNAIPVPADHDGDGITDMGVFNPANSLWQVAGLGNIPLQVMHVPGDILVPGDQNGDGKAEKAVFRPSTGERIIDKFNARSSSVNKETSRSPEIIGRMTMIKKTNSCFTNVTKFPNFPHFLVLQKW